MHPDIVVGGLAAAFAAILFVWVLRLLKRAVFGLKKRLRVPNCGSTEAVWVRWLAQELGGETEVTLSDGSRADIITRTSAVEVDWIEKWKESVGQACLYASLTGKRGLVVILADPGPDPRKERVRRACSVAGIRLAIVDVSTGTWEEFR